jgi:hypothetical protein
MEEVTVMCIKCLVSCAAILGLQALSGCLGEESQQDARAQLDAMRVEIESSAGVPACSDSGTCALIAFGSKPCGGPWTYLIYSTANVDPRVLADKVEQYNELEDRYNHKYPVYSDCMVAPVPRLTCVDGVCVGR